MSENDLLAALERFAANSKLIALLDEPGLQRLAEAGRIVAAETGMVVVNQGDHGDDLYLIVSGRMSVHTVEAGGEVAMLEAGMFFGEIAVMTEEPRSATVIAAEDSELIAFDRQAVQIVFGDYPHVREVIGSIGVQRTEENLSVYFEENGPQGGLAEMLEGDDDDSHLDEQRVRRPDPELDELFEDFESDLEGVSGNYSEAELSAILDAEE